MTKKKMKKLLLTTALILGLASCETEDTRIDDYRDKENLPVKYINHFEYKGHDYILFETEGVNSAVGGVVHDPDCKCKANKEE